MAKGDISKTYTNNSAFTAILTWSSTPNTANNNSSVTASLKIRSNFSWAVGYNWNNVKATITINGNSASQAVNHSVGGGATTGNLFSRRVTVAHDSDGTKKVNIGFSINFGDVSWHGSKIGSTSASNTVILDMIPRASSIGTISGSNIGSAITIPINRASTEFTHDVTLKLGNAVATATNVATSAVVTPNLADFCNQLTNSNSGAAVVTVTTKKGSTVIGSSSKTHTIYVPSRIVPVINATTFSEANQQVVDKVNLTTGKFVQGKSSIYPTTTAVGGLGSWITAIRYEYNQEPVSNNGWGAGGIIGANTIKTTVVDARGRTTSKIDTVTVLEYSIPRITSLTMKRNGTQISITIEGKIWNLEGKNTGTFRVEDNGSSIHSEGVSSVISKTITLSKTFDITKSFTLVSILTDKFTNATVSRVVSTEKNLIDFYKDEGIGIGKLRERGVLDVNGDAYFNRGTAFDLGVMAVARPGNATLGSYWTQYPKGLSMVQLTPASNVSGLPFNYGLYLISTDGWDFFVQAQNTSSPQLRITRGNPNLGVSWTTIT